MAEGAPTALVTGAARGLGAAIAQRLAADGWQLALVDAEPSVQACAESLAATTPTAGLVADVGETDQVTAAVESALSAFGRLDGLVNNAGVGLDAAPEALDRRDWDRVLAVNLTGPFLLAREAAPHLRATGGAVVNIASTRALQSEPHSEPYAASKGGLVALTHALAASLGPAIRVNCVSPGWIDTAGSDPASGQWHPDITPEDHEQHLTGRVGRPEDIAAAVAFLLDGRQSGFIAGENMIVDGGMTRRMIYAA